MRKFITRITMLAMAIFTMAIMTALPVTAFAAEADETVITALDEDDDTYTNNMSGYIPGHIIMPLGGNGGNGGNNGVTVADEVYHSMWDEVLKWVFRLGTAVLFVGALIFGLGWKDDNATTKENGLKVVIAGAIAMALSAGADMFHLFD